MKFVDSNIFIHVLTESPEKSYEISRSILQRIENGEEALTSTAVIQEVLDWLEYNNHRKEVKIFVSALNSYHTLRKANNEWKDFPAAAEDAEKHGMDFVDALTLQVMKRERMDEIYSNDLDFDRVEGIKRIFE